MLRILKFGQQCLYLDCALRLIDFRPEDENPINEFNVISSYYGHVHRSGHADFARQVLRAINKPLIGKRERHRQAWQ